MSSRYGTDTRFHHRVCSSSGGNPMDLVGCMVGLLLSYGLACACGGEPGRCVSPSSSSRLVTRQGGTARVGEPCTNLGGDPRFQCIEELSCLPDPNGDGFICQ